MCSVFFFGVCSMGNGWLRLAVLVLAVLVLVAFVLVREATSEERESARRVKKRDELEAVCKALANEVERVEQDAHVYFSMLEQRQKHVKPGDVEVRKRDEEYVEVDLWEELEGFKKAIPKTIEDSRRAYHEAVDRLRVHYECEDARWRILREVHLHAQFAAHLEDREPACRSLNQRDHHEGV